MIWLVIALTLIIWGWVRRDWHRMKSLYNRCYIPWFCWVKYGKRKEYDYVAWGKTRHRFLRNDMKKDRRYSNNFLIPYPTKLVCGNYTMWIPRLKDARKCYSKLQYKMNLRLVDMPFLGELEWKNNPYEFFDYNKTSYIRWCLKLLEWNGAYVVLGDYDTVHGVAKLDGKVYYIYCYYRKTPVGVGDLRKLAKIPRDVTWILIAPYGFTPQANRVCVENGFLRMDLACLVYTPKYGRPRFM